LKLGAAQAIFPDFEGQLAAFYLVEPKFRKKLLNISEREDGFEIVFEGLCFKRFNDGPPDSVLLRLRQYCQAPDFSDGRRIEMEGATTGQHIAIEGDREIANVFGQIEFSARQHDSVCGVAVDQREHMGNIPHTGLPHGERTLHHAGTLLGRARSLLSRVPSASLASKRTQMSGSLPGAIVTSSIPCSKAVITAWSFACMPRSATPDSINFRISGTVKFEIT
jgi:hypothetical protein